MDTQHNFSDDELSLIEQNSDYENLLTDKDPFICTIDTHSHNLLLKENAYYLTFREYLSLKINKNLSVTTLQNVIQYYYRKPLFINTVILENNTNKISEMFQSELSHIPFEIIVSEHDSSYIDFISERVIEDRREELLHKTICGFYINVNIPADKKRFLTLYDFITPFIVKNNEIIIIEKNPILKYWAFFILEESTRPCVFKTISISGDPIEETNDALFASLKNTLDMGSTTEETIKRYFKNNYPRIITQRRESTFSSLLTSLVYKNKQDVKNVICNIIFDLYFTIDIEKQKEFLVSFFKQTIHSLKLLVSDYVSDFNTISSSTTRIPYNFVKCNDDIKTLATKMDKKYSDEHDYYTIKTPLNIFRYICQTNGVFFGTNLLSIEKHKVLEDEKYINELNELENKLVQVIEDYFNNVAEPIFVKKIKLLEEESNQKI